MEVVWRNPDVIALYVVMMWQAASKMAPNDS